MRHFRFELSAINCSWELAVVSVRLSLPVPAEFVALNATVDVPADDGVPEISPVEVSTVNPASNPDAPKLVGEFVAVI